MIEQANCSEPQQKILTSLHRKYSEGINLLKQRKFDEGTTSLLEILQHPYIHDADLDNLKFSIYMSLAQVQEAQEESKAALGFYWQALQILQKRMEVSMKGQANSKVQEERPEQEFTLLLKMVLIAESLHLSDELVYLLKKAIKLSPTIWRQKLLLKLKDLYEREKKVDIIKDLDDLMSNKDKIDQLLAEKSTYLSKRHNNEHNKLLEELKKSDEERKTIAKITIFLNLNNKDQIFLKYSCWQTLLTITYVLLKCQSNRGFNKKKYFHRKFDDNNKDWCRFLKQFDVHTTKVQLVFSQKSEQNEKIIVEGEEDPDWGKIISDAAHQLLKYRYLKKKTKKPFNPLEQLTRLPSVSSKDPKKAIAAQTKSIFTSLHEYYKEQFARYHYEKESLNNLKVFGEQSFNNILGDIMKEEIPKTKEKNQQDQIQASYSAMEGQSSDEKNVSKQKKPLKVKKMELIAYQKQLSSYIPLILRVPQNNKASYYNIIQMVEKLTEQLMDESYLAEQKQIILNCLPIRQSLEKNILKVLEKGQGFFSERKQTKFMELLLEKLEHIVDKEPKSKNFKDHQCIKKERVLSLIKELFLPSTLQIHKSLSSDLQLADLKKHSFLCLSFVKINSQYQMINPSEIAFYRDLFIIFKEKQQNKADSSLNLSEIHRKAVNYIDKQIEKYQKKSLARSSIMNIQSEKEEKNSVDEIYKKDTEILAVLPLLRVFNCHPEQIKSKSVQMIDEMTGEYYLLVFIKICELFFKKIELQSAKQFNCRLLALLCDIINLKQVIQELYNKFSDSSTFMGDSYINKELLYKSLLYLIRIYLLNLPEDSDCSIKIAFLIFNLLAKSQPQGVKYIIIPKCICMFDDLVKYKKNKAESLPSVNVKKRYYQHLIIKNIDYIYNSPLFVIEKDQKQNKKSKKMHKKCSQESQMVPQAVEQVIAVEQKQISDIRERIFDILHDIYFCPEKEKQFTPRRIEEAVGYFMYLLRAYYQMFQEKVIQLENDALKVFKKCYKLYLEKKDEIYKLCWKFKAFGQTFNAFMNGDQTMIEKDQFLAIVKGEKAICECCGSLRKTHSLHVQSMFVIGKFFETQFDQPELAQSKQQWLEDIQKDANFYLDYLLLNLQKEEAWQNLIRVNCTKSFYYFDSILNKPFEQFKNKFYLTKKIIHFVNQTFPNFKETINRAMANLQLLNLLKIKERQYLMIQKDIELNGLVTKESKQLQKKYVEGMKRIQVGMSKQPTSDVRIRYIRWSEIKLKLVWNTMIKDTKTDKPQDTSVVIELDQQSNNSKIIHKPSKAINQLVEVIEEARGLIQDITTYSGSDHVAHLLQDIVVQIYVLLSRNVEWKIQKMISALCESIKCSNGVQRSKKMRQAQFFISEVKFLIQLFGNGQFLTNNPRYKLLEPNLMINEQDSQKIQSTFTNIFTNHDRKTQVNPMIEKEEKAPQDAINLINEDVQPHEEPKSRISDNQIESKSQRSRSGSQEKKKKPSKTLTLDLAEYIHNKLVDHIVQNKLFKHPLNHIQDTLYSHSFQELVIKSTKIFNEVIRVILQLPKYQFKKQKYRRSVVLPMLYCAHLAIVFTKLPSKANELVKEYYTFKNDEFTLINTYCDRIAAEKNELLMDFYNRLIVHHIMKIQFMREVFQIFYEQRNKDSLTALCKKMMKANKASEIKVDKEKGPKNQQKGEMEDQAKKDTTNKDNSKQLQSITTFNLFCQGVSKLVKILAKQSEEKQIEEKYGKAILEFKNRIRKKTGDEKNNYLQKIQQFLTSYHVKYEKKFKLKKTKKDRQLENAQKNPENVVMQVEKPAQKFAFLEKPQNTIPPITFIDLPIPNIQPTQLKKSKAGQKQLSQQKKESKKLQQLPSKKSKESKPKRQTAENKKQSDPKVAKQQKQIIDKEKEENKATFQSLCAEMKERLAQMALPKNEIPTMKEKKKNDQFVEPFIIIEGARNRPIQIKQSPVSSSKGNKPKGKKQSKHPHSKSKTQKQSSNRQEQVQTFKKSINPQQQCAEEEVKEIPKPKSQDKQPQPQKNSRIQRKRSEKITDYFTGRRKSDKS